MWAVNSFNIYPCLGFRIIESLGLEKTFKLIWSNHPPTKSCHCWMLLFCTCCMNWSQRQPSGMPQAYSCDITNVFFLIHFTAVCRSQFTFTWRGIQYTWNQLPQRRNTALWFAMGWSRLHWKGGSSLTPAIHWWHHHVGQHSRSCLRKGRK